MLPARQSSVPIVWQVRWGGCFSWGPYFLREDAEKDAARLEDDLGVTGVELQRREHAPWKTVAR